MTHKLLSPDEMTPGDIQALIIADLPEAEMIDIVESFAKEWVVLQVDWRKDAGTIIWFFTEFTTIRTDHEGGTFMFHGAEMTADILRQIVVENSDLEDTGANAVNYFSPEVFSFRERI